MILKKRKITYTSFTNTKILLFKKKIIIIISAILKKKKKRVTNSTNIKTSTWLLCFDKEKNK